MFPYPLTRANRQRLARAFASVPIVDISIEALLEEQMGKAFVDDLANPRYFMIEQDGFFCYFAGDFSQAIGRDFLTKIPHGRMLMAGSSAWDNDLSAIFPEGLFPIKRFLYGDDTLSLNYLQQLAEGNPHTASIQRIDAQIISQENPFISVGAFDSADDFFERGIGYCLIKEEKFIGVAYSSLVSNRAIEVSIVVDENYHRQGIATALAAQLLIYCLEQNISPHWDAANEESCFLAEKLGYRKIGDYRAYYLK